MKNKLFNFFKSNQNAGTYTESDLSSEKYLSTKKWEWSYLRVCYWSIYFIIWEILKSNEKSIFQKECQNLGLDIFYRTYIHRMQRSYLTLMFSIQIFVAITHIVILLVDDDSVSWKFWNLFYSGKFLWFSD